MWYINISIFLLVVLLITFIRLMDAIDDVIGFLAIWVMSGVGLFILGIPILSLTSGFFPGYSVGERTGYVTKISKKGIIWKTNEGQMTLGVGEQSSLQTPWEFSITDEEILTQIKNLNGRKVTISYIQWLIMPYSVGDSSYLIVSVK